MTNELEKKFFDAFGIERKRNHKVTLEAISGGVKSANLSQKPFYEYPQITDRVLLELICLCPDLDEVFFTDVERLKETLLTSYIKIYRYYTEVEQLSDCEKELKHQVRKIFKER